MKKILWIAPKWPFPAQDGARVATVRLLEGLCKRGHAIGLLAIHGADESVDENEAVRKLGVKQVFQVRRKGRLSISRSVLRPWIPLTLGNYAQNEVATQIAEVLNSGEWQCIVYDGLHPAIHSSKLGNYVRPQGVFKIVYRAHNHETSIWRRKAEQVSLTPLKMFFRFQAKRVGIFEESLVRACDGLAPVSEEDLAIFKRIRPDIPGRVVPIGYDFGKSPLPLPPSTQNAEIMFLGRLDWPPNREGLQWFLKEVWPMALERRPDLHLSVAGSGKSDWLKPILAQASRVSFLGRVEDLDGVYEKSILSIVPVFFGSGTRVKVIEASRYGRACLSTALGVEGTGLVPGSTYLRAEKAGEWIDTLSQIDLDAAMEMGRNAYKVMSAKFDVEQASAEFEKLL